MIINELIITFRNVDNNEIFVLRVFMILKSQVDTKCPVLFIFNRDNLMTIVDCINRIIADLLTFENINKCLVVQCNSFVGKNKMYFSLMNWVLSIFSNFYLCFTNTYNLWEHLKENFKFQVIYFILLYLIYLYIGIIFSLV
jgi:hypothetical protein